MAAPLPSFPRGRAGVAAIPPPMLTDSYKACHWALYPPDAVKAVAYGEFRRGFRLESGAHDKEDTRLVFYGMHHIVTTYLERRWTREDIDAAAAFYSTHNAGGTPFPFPRELFESFVAENDGYFPVRLEALPEGTVVHARCPVFQVTAEGPYAGLCTYLETLLTMVWYPTTVATLSRRIRDTLEAAFERSVEGGAAHAALPSRLHDFGMRGCTCVEQAVLGGSAHLLSFSGTDTVPAAFYAQAALNDNQPVASSIPATEHSVMMSGRTEREAFERMIRKYGGGTFAIVMDTFDFSAALAEIVPAVAAQKLAAGGFLVLRPDSGDQAATTVQALEACARVFGCDTNAKGFAVPRGCGVLQGDSMDAGRIAHVLDAVMAAGFSAQSVAFGIGGALLQKVHRDTMSFATKLCHVAYADGATRDVMKTPAGEPGKFSLPGIMQVRREADSVARAYSVPDAGRGAPLVAAEDNLLRVVYNCRPVQAREEEAGALGGFDALRRRVARQWAAAPRAADALSPQLRARVDQVAAAQQAAREAETAAAHAGREHV